MKKVQHPKRCNMKKVQDEKSATRKNCNKKRVQHEKALHEKSATCRVENRIFQHGKSATWK